MTMSCNIQQNTKTAERAKKFMTWIFHKLSGQNSEKFNKSKHFSMCIRINFHGKTAVVTNKINYKKRSRVETRLFSGHVVNLTVGRTLISLDFTWLSKTTPLWVKERDCNNLNIECDVYDFMLESLEFDGSIPECWKKYLVSIFLYT